MRRTPGSIRLPCDDLPMKTTVFHRCASLLAVVGLAPLAPANDLQTDFEFQELSGNFTVGTAPLWAVFNTGVADVAPTPDLAHGGTHAFLVEEGHTGLFFFGNSPTSIEFFLRSEGPQTQGEAVVRDLGGQIVGTFPATSTGWTHVQVTAPIGHVQIVNASVPGQGCVAIDDLTVRFGETSTYCTAKTNSQGCTPGVAFSGMPSLTDPTPFDITASQVISRKPGLLFYGHTGRDALPFQGGTLCVHPPILRTPVQSSGGNPPPDDCSGTFHFDFNAWIQSGSDPIINLGSTLNAQFWYRDPRSPSGTGLTNAIEFIVCS